MAVRSGGDEVYPETLEIYHF